MGLQPLNTNNGLGTNFNQVNNMIRQLDKEQTVKTFKQPGGNAIVQGKYAEGLYGTLMYDNTGVRRLLMGQHPVTGAVGVYISKEGLDVIDELEA